MPFSVILAFKSIGLRMSEYGAQRGELFKHTLRVEGSNASPARGVYWRIS